MGKKESKYAYAKLFQLTFTGKLVLRLSKRSSRKKKLILQLNRLLSKSIIWKTMILHSFKAYLKEIKLQTKRTSLKTMLQCFKASKINWSKSNRLSLKLQLNKSTKMVLKPKLCRIWRMRYQTNKSTQNLNTNWTTKSRN